MRTRKIESVDRKWKNIKNRILGALEYRVIKMKKRRKIGHRWNRGCTRKKKEVKRKYERWWNSKEEGRLLGRKEISEGVIREEKEKMEKRKREEEELTKLKDEKKIWNYITVKKRRKNGKRIIFGKRTVENTSWRH